jgi:hypothetical protein
MLSLLWWISSLLKIIPFPNGSNHCFYTPCLQDTCKNVEKGTLILDTCLLLSSNDCDTGRIFWNISGPHFLTWVLRGVNQLISKVLPTAVLQFVRVSMTSPDCSILQAYDLVRSVAVQDCSVEPWRLCTVTLGATVASGRRVRGIKQCFNQNSWLWSILDIDLPE